MKSIRGKLAIATCTLLSQGAQQAGATESSWTTDASYLFYSEADRVTVNKVVTNAEVTLGDNHLLTLEAVYDTITGATPTGAVKALGANVSATTPSSGGNAYELVSSGNPALAKFGDTRLGVNLGLTHAVDRTLRLSYGGSVSVERDYEAYGASLTVERDNEDRSTTLSTGIAGSYDTIFQSSGRTPEPMTEAKDDPKFIDEAGNKRGIEGMLGISRVINRRTVARLNYTIKLLEGYLTDPYKVISVVKEGTEFNRYFESRPDSRLRQTLYGKLVHQLENRDTIQLSYRYYWDDWDISSHTIDYRHRRGLSDGQYLEPHLRLYTQSAAKFFYHSLPYMELTTPEEKRPEEYASADYRLDEMNSVTLGLKYGRPAWGGTLRFRLEYLYQSFAEAEFDTNKALIFQASFKKEFD